MRNRKEGEWQRQTSTSAVKEAVVGALALDEDEVTPDATLMDDLGAESIDLLDILFRIERSDGSKIQAADLGDYIQGGIPDDEFGDDGQIVTAKGPEQLQDGHAADRRRRVAGNLNGGGGNHLFTVQNLADMVKRVRGATGRTQPELRVGIDIVGVERLERRARRPRARQRPAVHRARAGLLPRAPRLRAPGRPASPPRRRC